MKKGVSKICDEYKDLRDSHAIPDSFFKIISRKYKGQLIAIHGDDDTPSFRTSETFDDPLMCMRCE